MKVRAQKPNPSASSDSVSGQIAREPILKCPICGNPDFQALFEATDRLYRTTDRKFQIVECKQCRLIRLFPQPSPDELRAYYPETYWFSPEEAAVGHFAELYRR